VKHSVPFAVGACLGLAVAARAAPAAGGSSDAVLPYAPGYERYRCELAANSRKHRGYGDAIYKHRIAIEARYEGKVDNPYPAALGDLVPSAYQLAERILLPLPCEAKPVALPKGFRCRLDRLVLRSSNGKEFAAEAASVHFGFRYVVDGKDVVTEAPLALRHGNPRPYGGIILKGRYDSRHLYLSRSWALGFPRHSIRSDREWKDFKPDQAETLPVVTAGNARLYVFDFAADEVQQSEPMPRLTFPPVRCRS